jgi:C-3',4' desaturase CrtD
MTHVVVVGAGIGGVTTAALLAKAGVNVTVLEAHVYPGGCAGTFFHQKFRFDAGATLAGGFYPGGPMDLVAQAAGVDAWPAHPSDPAMVTHLPDGMPITRFGGEARWDERREKFGSKSLPFWQWQEKTADALWSLALEIPPWPPQSVAEGRKLVGDGLTWLANAPQRHIRPALVADAFRPVAAHLPDDVTALRLFVDGQLLIASQTTSQYANALYGASALDLPRRGVVHLQGGIGAIADTLAQAVKRNGGQVLYKHEVSRVVIENGHPVAVETKRGKVFPADAVVLNPPPWNIAPLLGNQAPQKLRTLPPMPADGWGAFMTYVGIDAAAVPSDLPLHHQVIMRQPLAEGNTVFLSLSPDWDTGRAPAGQRAITLSTHTNLHSWWQLFNRDRAAYEARKAEYAERMLKAAQVVLPHLHDAVSLVLPGTPVTFQRFTRRKWGWVGGFPQVNLFRTWAPRLMPSVWMVGDTIFPGQSTAAVAMGGMRVAAAVLSAVGASQPTVLSSRHRASISVEPTPRG